MNLEVVGLGEGGKQKVLAALAEIVQRVESGTTIGIVVLEESMEGYSFTRSNVPIQTALGMVGRAAWSLNQDWDVKIGRG